MRINSVSLLNVRNHRKVSFDLYEETLFSGQNGSGKTTVLEAVYLLLAMKGFKKQAISKIVSFNESFMVIKGEVEGEYISDISLKYDGKKTFSSNGTVIEKISDYIYSNPTACFSPDYQGVLSKDQSERRSFADRFAFYADKAHMDDVRTYNRLISQKTAEFESPFPDKTYIEVLNQEIERLSYIISSRRKNILSKINEDLEQVYKNADIKIEPVFVGYSSNINDKDILKNELSKKRCDYGIHRDKIDMYLDGEKIEKFSSFGQKKTFALLCLLGAIKYIENLRKISIIALLDDFEAGLDLNRASLLKSNFSSGRQAIYTGVDNARLGFEKNIILQ